MTRKRYVLAWTFRNIDAAPQRYQREVSPDTTPERAYQHKVEANQYLVGGAEITEVCVYEIETTERWTMIYGGDDDANNAPVA